MSDIRQTPVYAEILILRSTRNRTFDPIRKHSLTTCCPDILFAREHACHHFPGISTLCQPYPTVATPRYSLTVDKAL